MELVRNTRGDLVDDWWYLHRDTPCMHSFGQLLEVTPDRGDLVASQRDDEKSDGFPL